MSLTWVQPLFLGFRLSFHIQVELAENTHEAVAGICEGVSMIREEVGGRIGSVSPSLIPSMGGECLRSPRSQPGQQPRFTKSPVTYICI